MFDLGLRRAGHVCVGACEIDSFARKVRTARLGAPAFYPEDINGVRSEDIPAADFWVGGSPCQGFSVAGKRGGLEDNRSGLLRVWIGLLAARRPRGFILENVPGILSTCSCAVCGYAAELIAGHRQIADAFVAGNDRAPLEGIASEHRIIRQHRDAACAECEAARKVRSNHRGRDFGGLLRSLGECGYRVGWRILDGRWFGVAQRRRRVFLVASLGDGLDPERVLFESAGGIRDFAASGKAKPGASGRAEIGTGTDRVGALRADDGRRGRLGDEDDLVAVGQSAFGLASGTFTGSRHAFEIDQSPSLRTNGLHPSNNSAAMVVASIQGGGKRGSRIDAEGAAGGHLVPAGAQPISCSLRGRENGNNIETRTDRTVNTIRPPDGGSSHQFVCFDPKQSGGDIGENICPTLRAGEYRDSHANGGIAPAVYTPEIVSQAIAAKWSKGYSGPAGDEHSLPGCGAHPRRGVRRLTPLECERLQSLPDGWMCLCAAKGETARCVCPDGPRYRAIGNGGVVNVMEWLGRRLTAAMDAS